MLSTDFIHTGHWLHSC
uniref:Uncharacterized protein n=1 Tax=Anguilla anguilla TaxID=7936 RepID=A0A0E9QWM7_ANGAN